MIRSFQNFYDNVLGRRQKHQQGSESGKVSSAVSHHISGSIMPKTFYENTDNGSERLVLKTKIEKCRLFTHRLVKYEGDKMILKTFSGRYYEMIRGIRQTVYGGIWYGLEVYKGTDGVLYRPTKDLPVAIKVTTKKKLSLSKVDNLNQENPMKELAIMQHISDSHDSFVQYVDCGYDADYLYTIMEFINGGELFDIVNEKVSLPESLSKQYFLEIIMSLRHLHSLSLAHRDLSLENILVTSDNHIKIIDYGMCIHMNTNINNKNSFFIADLKPCGKKNYIAPELFLVESSNRINPMLCDIWACGIMLFIMVTGIPPMESAQSMDERYHVIQSHGIKRLLSLWNIKLSKHLVDLLDMILRPDPYERPSLDDILNHPWLLLQDKR